MFKDDEEYSHLVEQNCWEEFWEKFVLLIKNWDVGERRFNNASWEEYYRRGSRQFQSLEEWGKIDRLGRRFGNPARRVARIPLLLPILFDRARENEVENDLSPPSAACISTVPLSFPPPRISPMNVSWRRVKFSPPFFAFFLDAATIFSPISSEKFLVARGDR